MSVVTTVIVFEDEWNTGDIRGYLESIVDHSGGQPLSLGEVDSASAGGGKVPEVLVSWGASKHIDEELVAEHLEAYVGEPGDAILVLVHTGTPACRFWTWQHGGHRREVSFDRPALTTWGSLFGRRSGRNFFVVEAQVGPADDEPADDDDDAT